MQNRQHLGFWLGLALVGFFLVPLMRSGASMEQFVADEVEDTRSALGSTVGSFVISFADAVFKEGPLGLVASAAKSAKHSKGDQELSERAAGVTGSIVSSMYNSYMQGLVLQAYIAAMRLAIVLVWLVLLAPLLIAAIFDGFMQRRVKRSEFGAIRPATFTVMGLIVIPMLAAPLMYLIVPFNISPLVAPLWALLVAVPLSILVSNMQPLFGR